MQIHIVTKFEYLNILHLKCSPLLYLSGGFLVFHRKCINEGLLAVGDPKMPLKHFSSLHEFPQQELNNAVAPQANPGTSGLMCRKGKDHNLSTLPTRLHSA